MLFIFNLFIFNLEVRYGPNSPETFGVNLQLQFQIEIRKMR